MNFSANVGGVLRQASWTLFTSFSKIKEKQKIALKEREEKRERLKSENQ